MMSDFTKYIIIYPIVNIILCCFWVGLEYILDGQVISLHSDTIMCLIMSWFITEKICEYIERRNK